MTEKVLWGPIRVRENVHLRALLDSDGYMRLQSANKSLSGEWFECTNHTDVLEAFNQAIARIRELEKRHNEVIQRVVTYLRETLGRELDRIPLGRDERRAMNPFALLDRVEEKIREVEP